MAGQPYVIRMVSGLRAPKNPVPGLDVASTVVAAGADVTGSRSARTGGPSIAR
jgi:NADPH:quinone reductase-like Zn-dependent oxidoreductase